MPYIKKEIIVDKGFPRIVFRSFNDEDEKMDSVTVLLNQATEERLESAIASLVKQFHEHSEASLKTKEELKQDAEEKVSVLPEKVTSHGVEFLIQ